MNKHQPRVCYNVGSIDGTPCDSIIIHRRVSKNLETICFASTRLYLKRIYKFHEVTFICIKYVFSQLTSFDIDLSTSVSLSLSLSPSSQLYLQLLSMGFFPLAFKKCPVFPVFCIYTLPPSRLVFVFPSGTAPVSLVPAQPSLAEELSDSATPTSLPFYH